MRTPNVVVSFMDLGDAPVPMSTDFNVSTWGYRSPDSPFRYAKDRLKSTVTIDKSIGAVFWNERSQVEFGSVDIGIEDGGLELQNGAPVDWVEWAKDSPTPLVVVAVQLPDGSLEHIATAEGSDIEFVDDKTIRVKLNTLHGMQLDQFVNNYYSGVNDELDGLPIPLYWGAGNEFKVVPVLLRDAATLRYDVTDLDLIQGLSPSPYRVYDRGVELEEGMSPGFTIVDNGFELASNPDGKVTFAMVPPLGGGVEDPLETGELLVGIWRICRYALYRAGIDVDTYFPDESAFTELQLGVEDYRLPIVHYLTDVTAREIMDVVLDSVGGWWYVDEMGMFNVGRLVPPEDQPLSWSFTDANMIGSISAAVDKAPGLSTRLAYGWRPGYYQQSELAGAVPEWIRSVVSYPWGNIETQESVPALYNQAYGRPPMEMLNSGTGVIDSTNAYIQDELDWRWSELYYTTRRFYSFTIPLFGNLTLPELGQSGLIQSDLFRLIESGVAVYVRRLKLDLGEGLVQVEGWGGEYPTGVPPSAASNLTANGVTAVDSSIDLAWDAATGETGYLVRRSLTSGSGYTTIDTVGAGVTTYSDTSTTPGETYYYRIMAVNGTGQAAPSNTASAYASDVWSYATLATAQASGDTWVNTDIIRITTPSPDVDFRYWSALDTNGHSGLLHRFPFGGSAEYTPTVSTAVSGDPDSWSGWAIGASAFETQDAGGNGSRFIASTDKNHTWRFPSAAPTQPIVFSVTASLRFAYAGIADGFVNHTLAGYVNGTTQHRSTIGLNPALSATFLNVTDNAGQNQITAISAGVDLHLYRYQTASAHAVWSGETLVHSGVPKSEANGLATSAFAGDPNTATNTSITLSRHIHGSLAAV